MPMPIFVSLNKPPTCETNVEVDRSHHVLSTYPPERLGAFQELLNNQLDEALVAGWKKAQKDKLGIYPSLTTSPS